MPETGVLRLLNPLSIRFSQPRVAPHFRDGHLLEDTAAQVRSAPLEDEPAFQSMSEEAAQGVPPYDVVILPPFPVIRVISWMPKIRGADGEAERDYNGDQILGKRAWFALDNRRLWSLQTAAAKAWPKRCCAVVRCLEDVPGTTIRELRKFRTTTEGKQIELGVRTGETATWSWLKAAPEGAFVDEDTCEGLFAEDLWDAEQWAPQAAAAGCERDPEDFVHRKDAIQEDRERAIASRASNGNGPVPATSNGYGTGPATSNGYGATLPVTANLPMPHFGQGGGRRGEMSPCPDQGWEYIDPAGKTQGPFDCKKMRLWHEHGYFYGDLLMRSSSQDAFVPFSVLFPKPTEPFLGIVMRFKLQ